MPPIKFPRAKQRLKPVGTNQINNRGGGAGSDSTAIHTNISSEIIGIPEKTNPVDADLIVIEDSENANNKKRAEIGNLPGMKAAEWGLVTGILSDQTDLDDRFNIIESRTEYYELFENITSGTTGTITKPVDSTILLNRYSDGKDCVIVKVDSNNRPTENIARESDGTIITATFDTAGDYVLSGTASAYPVSLVYQISIAAVNSDNVNINQIVNKLELHDASEISVDASGFGGTLSTADNDVQKALSTLNDTVAFEQSTGLVKGGVISVNATTTLIDITAGSGQIVDTTTDPDNPVVTPIAWIAKTGYNLTTTAGAGDVVAIFLSLDSNGDVIERSELPSATERRNTIDLGLVARDDSNVVVVVANTPTNIIHNPTSLMQDFFENWGAFSISGNEIAPNATDLQIKKEAGTLFRSGGNFRTDGKNPNVVISAAQEPVNPFNYKLSDGTDVTLLASAIDPDYYDSGASTKTAVPTGKFTIQRIAMFSSNILEIMYGQELFNLLSEAKAALPTVDFIVPADSKEAIPFSYLIVKQGCTDLTDDTCAEFFKVDARGEIGGIGYQQLNSAGMVYDPGLTDNVNGSIDVGDGVVNLFQTSDFSGDMKQYSLVGLDDQLLTNNDTNYIIADYNSGSPIFRVTLDVLEVNESDVVPVYTIYREDDELHTVSWGTVGTGLVNKLHARVVKTDRFAHESGLALGEEATREITTTAGVIWIGGTRTILPAANSGTDETEFWYHVSGVWTSSSVTTYNNQQYDDGTDLQDTGNGRFVVNWIYQGAESGDAHLYYVLGSDNYTLLEAQASPAPSDLPQVISSHAVLVGRIIVEEDGTTATQIDSAFTTQFAASPVTDHANLSGLQGGTAGEYYHITSAQHGNMPPLDSATNTDGDFNITGSNTAPTQGAEQVTNGDFTTDLTGWTNGGNWAQSAGTALHTAGSVATLSQDVTVVATNAYLIAFDVIGRTAGTVRMSVGGALDTFFIDQDITTYTKVLYATTTGALTFEPTTDFDGALDNVSVKLLTSSVALQSLYNESDEIKGETRVGGSLTNPSLFNGLESGRYSTAINGFGLGKHALRDLISGAQNIGIGNNCLRAVTTGTRNIIIGYLAGSRLVSGDDNSGFGNNVLQNNYTGSRNVAMGRNSGRNNTGSDNIFIGYASAQDETGSNKLYIANTATTTPLIYGEFDNQLLTINGDFTVYDTATNHTVCTGGSVTTTYNIGARWIGARDDATIESGNLLFSFRGASTVDTGTTVNSAAAIRFEAFGVHSTSSSPGSIVFQTVPDASTTLTDRMVIDSKGYIGIGTSAPKLNMQFSDFAGMFSLGAGVGQSFWAVRNIYTDDAGVTFKRLIADNDASALGFADNGDFNFYSNSDGNTAADSLITLQLNTTIAKDGGVFMHQLKSGTDQSDAGASANELYRDTADNTIKIGV